MPSAMSIAGEMAGDGGRWREMSIAGEGIGGGALIAGGGGGGGALIGVMADGTGEGGMMGAGDGAMRAGDGAMGAGDGAIVWKSSS